MGMVKALIELTVALIKLALLIPALAVGAVGVLIAVAALIVPPLILGAVLFVLYAIVTFFL